MKFVFYCFHVTDFESVWSRGIFSYIPVSISKSCDEVLNRERERICIYFPWIFSNIKFNYTRSMV